MPLPTFEILPWEDLLLQGGITGCQVEYASCTETLHGTLRHIALISRAMMLIVDNVERQLSDGRWVPDDDHLGVFEIDHRCQIRLHHNGTIALMVRDKLASVHLTPSPHRETELAAAL